ncbi:uncharacterized protein TNCV_4509411 [Trichonephila clavipes]|nr:uncharacterized protein TNCV_4509411 [Trichonephila clavipes]
MHNGHEWVQVFRQDAYVPVTFQSRIFTYQGSHIMSNAHSPYHHRASTSLNSPLLICRAHGFLRLSPFPYKSISLIQLETRLVRQGNVFPVINSPMSLLPGPREALGFVLCSQQGYTSRPSAPKAHIDHVSLNDSHGDTC